MSHVVTSKTIITDLAILQQALAKFPKLHWKEGQTKHEWFGEWVKDYHGDDAAYKNGIDPKQFGKCEHAISMDGIEYEIGVTKRADGAGYSIVWDFWGQGRDINDYIGAQGQNLITEYNRLYCMQYAQQAGLSVSETVNAEGDIVLTMSEY